MKVKNALRFVLLAVLAAGLVFIGCKSSDQLDPKPEPEPEPSGDAGLSSFVIGAVEASLPAAITEAVWDGAAGLNSLEEKYTVKITFDRDANLAGIAVRPEVSEKASVEYAVTTDASSIPGEFKSIDEPVTLSSGDYLYIKVTAEDGTINYYRFLIEQEAIIEPPAPPAKPVTGFKLGKSSTTLTLYSSEQLTWTFTPVDASIQKITWTSSAPAVVSVDANGKVTAAGVTNNLTAQYTVTPATGTATITGTTVDGGFKASITVNTTVKPQTAAVETVPAMKDQFKNYFMMGNIAGNSSDITSGTTATRLKRHYNILTAENIMKPSYYGGSRSGQTVNGLTYTNPDAFVKACADNGFKVHGHVLLWHSQNSQWITDISSAGKADALGAMKNYITQVVTHFKGKIYSWDVLNEVFPDNATGDWKTAMRPENPWFKSIGSDFVYEGYLAARKADPAAILYYNDFNTDMAGKAAIIRDMVRDVNARYLASNDKPAGEAAGRLLIEGIGMQEHHNTGVTAAAIRATINLFRPLGVKISVSELDVLSQGWGEYSSNPAVNNNPETANNTVTNQGLVKQSQLYGEYMKLYIENKDIIERVSLWGVIDSQSWRGKGLPLIFDKDGKAKPAYYKVISALE